MSGGGGLNINLGIVTTPLKQGLASAAAAFEKFFRATQSNRLNTTKQSPWFGAGQRFNARDISSNASMSVKAYQDYRNSIKGLGNEYGYMEKKIKGSLPVMSQQTGIMQVLQKQFNSNAETISAKASPAYALLRDGLRKAGYEGEIFGKSLNEIGRDFEREKLAKDFSKLAKGISGAFSNVGKQMSWFGFRLTMMGRSITRGLAKPVNKSIQYFQNWDKTINQVGTSMGYLAASGLLTGQRAAYMTDAMMKLPKVGMMLQGVMGAVAALFVNLGSDIIPMIVPPILDFIDALNELWSVNKSKVIPVIQTLIDGVFPSLISIIKDFGGIIIESLGWGLKVGIGFMDGFIEAAKPLIPTLAGIGGVIIGLAPLMSNLGTLLFSVSVPLQASGYAFGALAGGMATAAKLAMRFNLSFSPLTAIFFAVVGALMLMTNTFGSLDMLKSFTKNISKQVKAVNWTKIFTKWKGNIASAWAIIVEGASEIWDELKSVLDSVDWAAAWTSLVEWAGGLWDNFITWAGDFYTVVKADIDAIDWDAVWQGLWDWAKNLWTNFTTASGGSSGGQTHLAMMVSGISWDTVWDSITKWGSGLWDLFVKKNSNWATKFTSLIPQTDREWDDIWDAFFVYAGKIWDKAAEVATILNEDIFKAWLPQSPDDWANLWNGFWSFMTGFWELAIGKTTGLASEIKDLINNEDWTPVTNAIDSTLGAAIRTGIWNAFNIQTLVADMFASMIWGDNANTGGTAFENAYDWLFPDTQSLDDYFATPGAQGIKPRGDIDITFNLDIAEMAADFDIDAFVDEVSRRIADLIP